MNKNERGLKGLKSTKNSEADLGPKAKGRTEQIPSDEVPTFSKNAGRHTNITLWRYVRLIRTEAKKFAERERATPIK